MAAKLAIAGKIDYRRNLTPFSPTFMKPLVILGLLF